MSISNPSTVSPLRFSEHFIQEIGGAGPDIPPTHTSIPTIVAIQPPFDDVGHHEQSPVQPSKTLRNIKKSLLNLGRLVKEPWARFRQKSDSTSNGIETHVPQPFNIPATSDQDHHPHHSNSNHIHKIQPKRPARLPCATKTTNPPHHLSQPTNSAKVQINTTVDLDESRHRERLHRRALKKLKSIGQFRRRPNLILEMTEGRTTEPVEVARIRRAYTQRGPGGRRPATAVVTVPLHDEALESRPSMRRTISTRVPGSRLTCKGRNPTLVPKSRFAFHWNKYKSKKLEVLRVSPQETELVHENERTSHRSTRFLLPTAEASNRLSVVSMASCSSAVSGVSSMANSIYSVLSEDWNRPFFFSQSKSHRCPTSLQNNVRTLPPYDQVIASITTSKIERANTRRQMTAAAGRVRYRGLRNQDGSVFQLTPGHELQSTDIRITWREVTESFVEDNDDPSSAIFLPCLSALPNVRDSLGFIEYDDDGDEDEEESQDQRHQSTISDAANAPIIQCDMYSGRPGAGDWVLADPSRPVLDVNDTSAMIAAGIDPSEPHPNPETFYRLHHPAENQASIHGEPQEISAGADTDTLSCSYFQDLNCGLSSNDPVDNSMFVQNLHPVVTKTSQPISMCPQKTRKTRVLQKWICKPLKSVFSRQSQRSTHCAVTEIRRAGPGLDRSYSDTVTSANAKEWLHQLPGGHASAGRFDRDWLDAQPSSSSFVQPGCA
ncbi:hypothetical protein KI688_011022 [Linnemannia hyalina]|uniref:Uncharacterized protein n=1 Tax=Linnemannia hyalina TaxID=64524 RepID=A0A9P8BTY1_9FUNG|nr:hypothetical protein KI688_011022 [Linnemannia hyalina]